MTTEIKKEELMSDAELDKVVGGDFDSYYISQENFIKMINNHEL